MVKYREYIMMVEIKIYKTNKMLDMDNGSFIAQEKKEKKVNEMARMRLIFSRLQTIDPPKIKDNTKPSSKR